MNLNLVLIEIKIFIKQVKCFLEKVKKNKKVSRKYDVLNGIKSLKLALKLKSKFYVFKMKIKNYYFLCYWKAVKTSW